METIQVVLDSKLLRAAEVAAWRTKLNRSAFIREALRTPLKNLAIRERELRDCEGYEAGPRDLGALPGWQAEAIWRFSGMRRGLSGEMYISRSQADLSFLL